MNMIVKNVLEFITYSYLRKEFLLLIFFTFVISFLLSSLSITTVVSGIDLSSVISILLILTIGLLHGSFDIFIKIRDKVTQKQGITKRMIAYVISIIFIAVIFYNLITLGILLFALISAYHFGEQNLFVNNLGSRGFLFLFRMFYGLTIILLIFYTNESEINQFLFPYIHTTISHTTLALFLLISIVTEMVFLGILLYRLHLALFDWFLYQIGLVSLFWFFCNSTLLLSFTFYFVFWHSLPSIRLQLVNNFKQISFGSFKKYCRKAFPYWAISVIGALLGLWYHFYVYNIERLLLSLAMAFVIPHIFLISHMIYDRQKYLI